MAYMTRGTYNRSEFIALMKEMLEELEEVHEDYTGVGSEEQHPFSFWQQELSNAEGNTPR